MIKNIIITISTILLLATNSFADNTTSNTSKKDTEKVSSDNTAQKIIDEFYTYAGTIKPEIREEITKYRIAIVKINKQKRELYNSLSKEAQNFLAEEQKYKKKLSSSSIAIENDKEDKAAKDNTDKNEK